MATSTGCVELMWYNMIDGGGSSQDLIQLFNPDITKLSSTTIFVNISLLGVTGTPTSYIVKYQRVSQTGSPLGTEQTQTSGVNGVTISGLVENSRYRIKTKLSNASTEGNEVEVFYNLPSSSITPVAVGSPKAVGEKVTAKSFLKIKGGDKADNVYNTAYKNFPSIQAGTYTTESIGAGSFQRNVRNYSPGFYSFGTSIIFEPLITYKPQGAALGFFLSSNAETGYFVSIETSQTAAARDTSPVKIFKLDKGKQIKKLKDSQKGNRSTLDQLFAGKVYNIDVKVRIENKSVTITAYVNGFKIEAVDTTAAASNNEILYPSQTVGLVGISGLSMFDYVYADTIQEADYNKDYQTLNFYNGQFAKDFLDFSYGDMLYNATNEDVDMTLKENSFDEFGTVVREITRRQVSFSNAPSVPIKWTTGANRLAQILGQTYDNFKADVIVMNNSSITIPLSDRGVNQLSIFGNTIGFSGEIEYSTSAATSYASSEPVIFESTWLQNENDVKSLAEWIQGRIVNKAKIITMEVFGNPLISVGDIITVNYEYQGFTSSQKIIVVKVSQSFGGGLKTEITGRTL